MKIQIIIPVYHPDEKFNQLLSMLKKQTLKDWHLLIFDSSSDKKYLAELSDIPNVEIQDIQPQEFNHGGTRQRGIDNNPLADIYVYLTQDAILANKYALSNLLHAFKDEKVGCAYGRQLPHKNASVFAAIARNYNYGDDSYVRSFTDRDKYGMKTAFISNSFAAYRRDAMLQVGGFPSNTILSEDMFVAAKMLMNGWKVAYRADARTFHSHNYTIWQEFKRYFDIGVFHAREKWIRDVFGEAEKNGLGFVRYEVENLKKKPWLIPAMIMRDGMKFIGYRLGIIEASLPIAFKKKLSMNKKYFELEGDICGNYQRMS